jgi:hypothetical protein
MAKRKFTLTAEEQKEVLRAYGTCKDAGTQTRFQTVRLYGEGYCEVEIEQITGCSRSSLMEWCRATEPILSIDLTLMERDQARLNLKFLAGNMKPSEPLLPTKRILIVQ